MLNSYPLHVSIGYRNKTRYSFSDRIIPSNLSSNGNQRVGAVLGSGYHLEGTVTRILDAIFEVDEDRCFGCAACIALCPVDALRLEGVMVYVDEPVCTHCKLCIPACPVFALNILKNSIGVVR